MTSMNFYSIEPLEVKEVPLIPPTPSNVILNMNDVRSLTMMENKRSSIGSKNSTMKESSYNYKSVIDSRIPNS